VTISIERSRDYALLMRIATEPRIYRLTSDDCSPLPQAWRIPEREDCIYLVARQDAEILGFAAFFPVNGITVETHLCFLRSAYGEKAITSFVKMLGWIWGATKTQRIIGAVPSYNRLAIRFAEKAGFSVYGVNQKAWMKDGRLHSLICLGISRP
jgi:RimJ/RimL family protein N-acetyltransferase